MLAAASACAAALNGVARSRPLSRHVVAGAHQRDRPADGGDELAAQPGQRGGALTPPVAQLHQFVERGLEGAEPVAHFAIGAPARVRPVVLRQSGDQLARLRVGIREFLDRRRIALGLVGERGAAHRLEQVACPEDVRGLVGDRDQAADLPAGRGELPEARRRQHESEGDEQAEARIDARANAQLVEPDGHANTPSRYERYEHAGVARSFPGQR